jgi:hypothetical protein
MPNLRIARTAGWSLLLPYAFVGFDNATGRKIDYLLGPLRPAISAFLPLFVTLRGGQCLRAIRCMSELRI